MVRASNPDDYYSGGYKEVTVPIEPFDAVFVCAKAIIKGCKKYCNQSYKVCTEAGMATDYAREGCTKAEAFISSLGPGSFAFITNIKKLKLCLRVNVITERGKRKPSVCAWQLDELSDLSRNFIDSAWLALEEFDIALNEWIASVDDIHATKSEEDRFVTQEELSKLDTPDSFVSLLDHITKLCLRLIPELEKHKPEPCDSSKILAESIDDLDPDFVIRDGLNMLAVSLIREGGIPTDELADILSSYSWFVVFLGVLKAYLGPEVLQGFHPDVLSGLLIHPRVLAHKLMNLTEIFQILGRDTTFNELCRVFLAKVSVNMLRTKRDDQKCSEFAALLEEMNRKITPNMVEEYERRVRQMKGVKFSTAKMLSLIFAALADQRDQEDRNKCRAELCLYAIEIEAILSVRSRFRVDF